MDCVTLSNRGSNERGIEVDLISLGASIHRIRAPDRQGKLADVVLYCPDLPGYHKQKAYLGATIGRYANRIGDAKFNLDGRQFRLSANEGENHLHGGETGFDKRIWSRQTAIETDTDQVQYRLVSESGDQGYPGRLTANITYQLTDDNRLIIDLKADTTEPTFINLTNHAYFNLSGDFHASLEGHYASILSRQICSVDKQLVPTGEIRNIAGTALDLQRPGELHRLLNANPAELKNSNGFDHCYVFDNERNLKLLATVCHRDSGRQLSVYSTHPGLQFYTGNHLADARVPGPHGKNYRDYAGFCLEAQHLPDSPHHANFPSTRLDPGQLYHQQIIYQFDLL